MDQIYSIDFVKDSIEQGSVQRLEDYRIMPKGLGRLKQKRARYTELDQGRILLFVKGCSSSKLPTTGNKLWQIAEERQVRHLHLPHDH